jgi:hypothetical protein
VVQVTHIRQAGGNKHEHITTVQWYSPSSGDVNTSTTATMVAWLRNKTNRAYVCDGKRIVEIGVVEATPPYIRTHADGSWTDNLLALPKIQ